MNYTFTPVPNEVLDVYLRELKLGELKVLLVIVRQTLGYITDPHNKTRRDRVWLSRNRLKELTGLSKKAISQAIDRLIKRSLVTVTNQEGNILSDSHQRAKTNCLIFQLTFIKDGGKPVTQGNQSCGKIGKKGNRPVYLA